MSSALSIDLIAQLNRLGVPARDARTLATSLLTGGILPLGPGLTLRYDGAGHLDDFIARIRNAAERVVARRRGRPVSNQRAPQG